MEAGDSIPVKQLSYEETIAKHRKERKDMLAITQRMKHSVSKGDKKKRKDLNVEIAKMFADLNIRQAEDLKIFPEHIRDSDDSMQGSEADSSGSHLNSSLNSTTTSTDTDTSTKGNSPKQSKAQKRRNRKSGKAKEREKAIQEQDILNMSGMRALEMTQISKILSERNLVLHEIPSDGDCLYNAIEHQLSVLNLQKIPMKTLRTLTANRLRSSKEEFLPFLLNEDGVCFSDEQFDKYCEDIANTSAWGGHVEVQILSQVCDICIEVIQAEGPSIIAGMEKGDPRLIISYHRHAYGLGEHYNSVVPKSLRI